MDSTSLTVMYFAILLGFGVIIANVLRKKNIPDTFFLLLLGLLFSPTVFMNPVVTQYVSIKLVDVQAMGDVPNFLRILALILVLFIGTFNLNFRTFKTYSGVSLRLAVIGVILTAVILGGIIHLMFGIGLVFALLLGAVLSGTETEVLVTFEKSLAKSKKAFSILKIESIFNSPMSVLVPLIFLDLVYITPGALFEPMKYASQFWLMIVAGLGTGLLTGLSFSYFFKRMDKKYMSLLMLSIALISYALAEAVGGSGALSVAVCGLVAGNFSIKSDERKQAIEFEDQLFEMLRISVFTLLGAEVSLLIGMQEIALILLFFVIATAVRPLLLTLIMGRERKEFTRRDFLMLSLVAPRGLSSAAMIPIVAAAVIASGQTFVAESMVNIVFLFVLFSVLFSSVVAGIGSMENISLPKRKAKKGKEEKQEKVEEKKDELSLMLEVGDKKPEQKKHEDKKQEEKKARGVKKRKGR